MSYAIVVIGTSWGGLHALRTIIGHLPERFALPAVVVQHRHRDSDGMLEDLLRECTTLTVTQAEDKMPLEPGQLYVAPPEYHLLIERGFCALSTEAPVRFSRPSIDMTFASVADSYGASSVGVVLTGANADGAEGLQRVVARGGYAIVQDPATAAIPIMPRAALQAVPTARVLALEAIAPALAGLPGAVAGAGAAP